MQFSGADSLKKVLSLPNISTSQYVIYRKSDMSYCIRTIDDYIKYMDGINWELDINIIMFSSTNLYIDIDTKSLIEWNKGVTNCNKLVETCIKNSHKNKIYPLLVGSSPTSLHLHIHGIWFDDCKYIPKFLYNNKFKMFDKAVYKNNSSLRVGLCINSNNEKIYKIVNNYGFNYNSKNLIKILTPSIPPKYHTIKIIKYIYKNPVQSIKSVRKLTIELVVEFLSRYDIKIKSYKFNQNGIYITPIKPWSCPICNRTHDNNNLSINSKLNIICFGN